MKKPIAVAILLVLAVLLVYGQTLQFDFVRADDPVYVTQNPNVRAGLTLENIPWAFSSAVAANWHPLTWYSHMLDVELFGMNAGGHHATSVVLHIANSILLFCLLASATNRTAPAAFAAFVFALHPLHVESVAWISERKDVLSTLFWLLSSLAYLRYGRTARRRDYWASVALMALGLASKPMVVTLPFVFLLLDYWPLRRWPPGSGMISGPGLRAGRVLIVEKLPMLALVAVSSVLTVVHQNIGSAFQLHVELSLWARIANAIVSYARYCGLLFWPTKLHLFYQHPYMEGGTPWSAWQITGAALLLALITALILRFRSRRYLAVGWLWFLGTLVPVIGVVQVGTQAIADRYMYIPMVGLLIVICFGTSDLLAAASSARTGRLQIHVVRTMGVVALLVLGLLSWKQVRVWKDAESLYAHGLAVSSDEHFEYMLHHLYGSIILEQGRSEEAAAEFRQAVKLNPGFAAGHRQLAGALVSLGDHAGAVASLEEALRNAPDDPLTSESLARLHLANGRPDLAVPLFENAVRLAPDFIAARFNLALALEQAGRIDDAISALRSLLADRPGTYEASDKLVQLLLTQGQFAEAEEVRREAVERRKGNPG